MSDRITLCMMIYPRVATKKDREDTEKRKSYQKSEVYGLHVPKTTQVTAKTKRRKVTKLLVVPLYYVSVNCVSYRKVIEL